MKESEKKPRRVLWWSTRSKGLRRTTEEMEEKRKAYQSSVIETQVGTRKNANANANEKGNEATVPAGNSTNSTNAIESESGNRRPEQPHQPTNANNGVVPPSGHEDFAADVLPLPGLSRQNRVVQPAQPGAYSAAGEGGAPERRENIPFALVGAEGEGEAAPDAPQNQTVVDPEQGLAHARPVQEDRQPETEAFPFDADAAEQKRAERRKQMLAFFLIMAAVLAGAVGILVMALRNHNDGSAKEETISAPTPAPPGAPSELPSFAPSDHPLAPLLEGLPEYTLASLENPSTPQWKAYEWLEDHPEIKGMEQKRMKQLFALATFFHAMHGPTLWKEEVSSQWMNHDTHECNWLSMALGSFSGGRWVESREQKGPCNEEQEYEVIILNQLGVLVLGDDTEDADAMPPHIPPEIEMLTALKKFELTENKFNSRLSEFFPTQFFGLSSLERLDFRLNDMTGTLPTQIGLLTSLETAVFDYNMLTGTMPTQLGQLSKLQTFIFSYVSMSGTIPTQIGLMTGLELVTIPLLTLLTGSIPSQIGMLRNLTRMELQGSQLSGTIPTQLGLLTNLELMGLNNLQLTGPIPSQLGLLTAVKDVWLQNNLLTSSIPTELAGMSSLNLLWLQSCKFLSGTIPSQLGLLSQMTRLEAYSNRLGGSLPSQLGRLPFERFFAQDNLLTGAIPSQFGNWTGNLNFVLRNNNLEGQLPSQLGLMSSTFDFSVSGNQLDGTLPTELGMLTILRTLGVYNNKNMTGPIPSELGNMPFLREIDLHGNQFSATIPGSLFERYALDSAELASTPEPNLESTLTSVTTDKSLYFQGEPIVITWNYTEEEAQLNDLIVLYPTLAFKDGATLPCCSHDHSFLATGTRDRDIGTHPTGSLTLTAPHVPARFQVYIVRNVIPYPVVRFSKVFRVVNPVPGPKLINLSQNKFTGPIPSQLGLMGRVATLSLSNNELTGPVPSQLGLMAELAVAELQENNLTSSIPSELGQLEKINSLDLSGNSLSGSIPASLFENFLGDPFETVEFSDVEMPPISTDKTSYSQIEPIIVSWDYDLDADDPLVVLDWHIALYPADSFNNGVLPYLPSSSTILKVGIQSGNRTFQSPGKPGDYQVHILRKGISSNWPHTPIASSTIFSVVTLGPQTLDLSHNSLTGALPMQLWYMGRLTSLSLAHNKLSGPVPTEFGLMPTLETLELKDNWLNQSIPSEMGLMTSLQTLDLSMNSISGTIPSELFGNGLPEDPNEEVQPQLNSSTNPIITNKISYFGHEPIVVSWLYAEEDVRPNDWVGMYPASALVDGGLPGGSTKWEYMGGLNGTVTFYPPYDAGEYQVHILRDVAAPYPAVGSSAIFTVSMLKIGLQNLHLNSNALTGPIPTETGLMLRLQTLDVQSNSLEGSIPSEIGVLPDLQVLQLQQNNMLTGIVPESICGLGAYNSTTEEGLDFDCLGNLCGCGWCGCQSR